jgi:predicted CXXCH cytochrome family protein
MQITNRAIYFLLIFGATLMIYCNSHSNRKYSEDSYLNLADSVKYVGMQTCRSCHSNIYDTFIETGMGKSFDKASKEKSGATFEKHDLVYDEKSDFYYKPYFQNDTMFVMEYRLSGKDTIHKRIEQIHYIVGSGQHTNSHIISENGYFFQAPITYYTQDKRWDIAPGFAKDNQRFSRFLTTECITCHNHYPEAVSESLNKYLEMPTGIACERCHGPGEIHVKEKLAGNIIDTSKYIDYTIVNPANLPKDLQMDVCQRCHLQGIPVLQEGKTFFDFKPGMKLSSVMNVFLPRYTDSHEQFIMASQADRLRLSKCYSMSDDLTCLTCHNPHRSVLTADKQQFNKVCINCHQNQNLPECSASPLSRNENGNNCVKCHMPPSSSIDIPHVRITDHYISRITDFEKREVNQSEKEELSKFLGLKMLTKENPEALEMAQGYIEMFDKSVPSPAILDSAFYYLNISAASEQEKFNTWVHYYFARKDYTNLIQLAAKHPSATIQKDWTAYRMGEAFYQLGKLSQSLLYYKKATQLSKFNLEFQEKLGANYLALSSIPQAKSVFEFILKENPKRPVALTNLGFLHVSQKQLEKGEALYDQALALDPDYVQALLNKTAIRLYLKDNKTASDLLKRILKLEPKNSKALALLDKI